ncbi:MAG: 50S ribosomal protein L31 [Dictyoglomus sp.]|nr:50S ribosomal protein L31 [Dictyoglomus sp.]MCX7942831.1 50S ribosomal protein L31 [Dictyoglomaceae bacterium]MDW8188361.1 50S ribosomal protein L31 [Dictyoglomus sp.]
MKKGIHPLMKKAKIVCACGAVYETLSTKEYMTTEICSKCHPFFTGQRKFVDTERRVEKFSRKYNWEIK